jgi:hypothetical protein
MKMEIVWPLAIGEPKNGENTHLWLPPKPGSDSSLRSIVRPSAVGGSKEDKHLCGGYRTSVRTGSRYQNRPSAWWVKMKKKDKENITMVASERLRQFEGLKP